MLLFRVALLCGLIDGLVQILVFAVRNNAGLEDQQGFDPHDQDSAVRNFPEEQLQPKTQWREPDSRASSSTLVYFVPLCWGGYHISAKVSSVQKVQTSFFFLDCLIAIALCSTMFFCIPGNMMLLTDAHARSSGKKYYFAMLSGALDVAGNYAMTRLIASSGLGLITTTCMASGLACGSISTYLVDRRGNLLHIIIGIILSMFAVVSNSVARRFSQVSQAELASDLSPDNIDHGGLGEIRKQSINRRQAEPEQKPVAEQDDNSKNPERVSPCTEERGPPNQDFSYFGSLLSPILAGFLLGCWSPMFVLSREGHSGFSPYGSFLVFCLGYCSFGIALLIKDGAYGMSHNDATPSPNEYLQMPLSAHLPGIVGGILWSTAGQSYALGGSAWGYAPTFIIGQASPVITAITSWTWFRELQGAQWSTVVLSVLSLAFYLSAVLVLRSA